MEQMDQQKRLLLTIVLSMAVMLLWTVFFAPKPPPPDEAGAGVDGGATTVVKPAPDAGAAPVVQTPPSPEEEQAPERRLELATPALSLAFTTRGGGLVQATVKDGSAKQFPEYKFRSREKSATGEYKPMEVVLVGSGQPPPGAAEVTGELSLPFGTMYTAEEEKNAVSFRGGNAQVALEKHYRVNPNGYELRVDYRVTNRTDSPKKVKLGVVYPARIDPKSQKGGSFFSPPPEITQAICRADSSSERIGIKDEKVEESFAGPVQFAGLDQRYFMGVIFPRFRDATSCTLTSEPDGTFNARIDADLGTIAPGETVTREFGMYLGPKSLTELGRVTLENSIGAPMTELGQEPVAKAGITAVDPELKDAVDYGWWTVIARVLLGVLKAFQKIVVNWGVAIILLTVLVKLLLYPLSHKQMESMESMRLLQPQIEVLTKKYGEDKEKLNLERMKLFQENKVNPLGGCLPLLIQMPVWIALYQTLLASFELYREPFVSPWIRDLTMADPYYILPLAMGVTMFITQKMQPQMGDPTQAKIMLYMMPVFFTFIMLNLPAGLTLYIFTNNLLSIAQQKFLQHRFAMKRAAAGGAGKS